ncbi:PucR family transcriptional regulator [Streptomyces sp. NPDC056296]|uniref:PucR family transcriptional regulator n=1 Tax=Streptomyces sp. NPDC056296 TaxID=3345775 RepID=UPI0035D7F3AD
MIVISGPLPSLGRVVDDLGSTLVAAVAGPSAADLRAGSVSIYDPADGVNVSPEGMLLGIGVTEAATVKALLIEIERCGGTALLLKTPVPLDDAIRRDAMSRNVCVLEVSRAASWVQLIILLRAMLDPPEFDEPGQEIAGYPSGDLFQLANAISSLLDAPITIEDRSSRVLAFSGGQADTDEGRIQTVLGRQVPDRYERKLTELGIFRELYWSTDPVYVPSLCDDIQPRTAIAVRAGDEVLGFVWAVVSEPLPEHRRQALVDAAKIVALHLLRERAGASVDTRLRAELLARLLRGSGDPHETARQLGLEKEPVSVLAVELAGSADENDAVKRTAEIRRVAGALAVYLSALYRSAAVTTLGDAVYALFPASGEQAALRVAEDFVERMGSPVTLRAGVGRVVDTADRIVRSRADADAVLRVLRESTRSERCATVGSVRLELMLVRLADILDQDELDHLRPVDLLLAYDFEHRSDLTGTLAAYLEAFGDVAKASAAVRIHPNTFRYRLKRLCEIGGLELADPDARVEALIDLRLRRLRTRPS